MSNAEYKYLLVGLLLGIWSVLGIVFAVKYAHDRIDLETRIIMNKEDMHTEVSNINADLTGEERAEEVAKYLNLLQQFFDDCDCKNEEERQVTVIYPKQL